MVGLGENSLVELMNQRIKEYFSVLVNHELVIPAREYIYEQTPAARLIFFTNLPLHPQKKTKQHLIRPSNPSEIINEDSHVQIGVRFVIAMCTQRHIVFTRCACTPVLIIKCSAQEFVEEQVTRSKRKPPLIYKYCVNFMITRDLWTGCCKRKAEGYVYGTQRDEDAKRGEG
jgi:hypothetical protein